MAYFPASCDYDCKDCSQNKCGWCVFHDRSINQSVTINPYNYSATIIGNEEIHDEDTESLPPSPPWSLPEPDADDSYYENNW